VNNNALLLRALRGPLTLIVTGILFVVDHSGALSFTKTWPILIIFLGVVRLAERAVATPPPPFNTQGGAQ
jgi:hypothetical protein